jgi:riboflavin kinase/FMN adenylyltransferase
VRILRGFAKHPGRGRVVTLGVFDGLHLGHVSILSALRRSAKRLDLPATVITFDDHPHGTLDPLRRPPRLVTDAQRRERFKLLGVEEVCLVRFTPRLAQMRAEDFVRRTLVRRLGMRWIVVGKDFVFGRNGRGDVRLLRRLGRELGFGVTVVPPRRWLGRVISSTSLRRLVRQGRMELARRQLGWPYALHGRVVHGEGRGTLLGVPTANLRTVHEIIPAPGVYAVRVRLRGRVWPALCHIGPRPTFHAFGPETIEIHIPGWRGALYGRKLEVAFGPRLRSIRRFAGPADLRRQIRQDWISARKAWRGPGRGRQLFSV